MKIKDIIIIFTNGLWNFVFKISLVGQFKNKNNGGIYDEKSIV